MLIGDDGGGAPIAREWCGISAILPDEWGSLLGVLAPEIPLLVWWLWSAAWQFWIAIRKPVEVA